VRVEKGKVVLSDGDEIPFGLGIWNTGIGPRPLVSKDTEVFSKDKWGHIATNDCLQVVKPTSVVAPTESAPVKPGIPSSDIYEDMFAFGDCASVGEHKYAATAQVAEQQGTWLAEHFNAAVSERSQLLLNRKDAMAAIPSVLEAVTKRKSPKPFQYHHGGSLAFIGSFTAVSDFTQGSAIAPLYGARLKGWVSWFIWRSAYLTKLGSWRNRLQVPADWTRTLIFGRDTTQF
jgi:NADH:ubiquinone reductase (non-electrogenic)